MTKIISWLLLFFGAFDLIGQTPSTSTLLEYLSEVKKTTAANRTLWNIDLYGPMLLVDPQTRVVFANESDSVGVLMRDGGLYRGRFPDNINIANTSIAWNGKRWAMILLPLSTNRNDRLNLLTHELFHRAQGALKFKSSNVDNNHLDKMQGRIYLRLELEALLKAVLSPSQKEAFTHIASALMFRKQRHYIFAGADSTENLLELNEGLAEYTGLIMSERPEKETLKHLQNNVKEFQLNKTFVRSFAYQTIPMYGFLTRKFVREFWNRDVTMQTDLTEYFISAFHVKIPADLETYAAKVWRQYNGEQISREEQERENANLKLIEEMTTKFVKNPHLEIPFEKMNVSFNPSNLIPLENYGTIYPTLRITDNWGILVVEDGALLSADWSKVTISPPVENDQRSVKGKGWSLELNIDQYTIIRDETTSNYYLKKK